MPSYQDLETRVNVLERKLDFMMGLATVTKKEPSVLNPGTFVMKQMSLKDLYVELSNAGELETVINGTDSDTSDGQ